MLHSIKCSYYLTTCIYPLIDGAACLFNFAQHSGVPLKIKRLARDPERFIWAVSIAQSRCINMQVRIGALVQDANMLIPYAGKHLSSHSSTYIS